MSYPLLCIPGPTAAGKTGAGIYLARELDGEVINFDSRQVYEDFPVITAQPSSEERAQCPHLLYGFLQTHQSLGAAAYSDLLIETIAEVRSRGKVPILVGGTGLYLKALLQPLAPIPPIPEAVRKKIQEACEKLGPNRLHRDLAEVDAPLAERLHPNDRQRIMRGLEVYEATKKPLSCWHAETVETRDFHAVKLGVGIPLTELTPYLYKRIDVMLDMGAMGEAKAAMEKNSDREAPGWTGIGCAELHAYLKQEIDLEECKALWGKNTRAYAKRQLTWFNGDKEIQWFRPREHEKMLEAARAALAE
ncbi:tRNA (adenosine(37)-N6)-dimethylallyltransferase MiaA [Desulfovibrio ferrophilus]|uniref:tRNA dimethylallyltransferase n=1 Tax=Desulfovibrio ferrophilus TaxID=241368 RepID=A0A2Z6AXA3_9BACT|nr:tRNA (adenosine(37)-N6)-dimethylallyltransferase MiaA [Desulfovibrio ferrophilus]BBD07838.1 tRNA dimethylallyltransferase [Desulfovibrio ferrophilus]